MTDCKACGRESGSGTATIQLSSVGAGAVERKPEELIIDDR
jgi:hypothetical protein